MRTNVLVQYKGGGYEGCFWEWNYFFIDADEKFHDIASSGRNGITCQEDAETLLEDGGVYIYDVTNDENMREFAKESNPAHVVGCVRWLIEHGYGEHAAVYCDRCGGIVESSHFGAWRGEGGIVIAPHEVYCENCATEEDYE